MDNKLEKNFEDIAKKHLFISTLQTRNSDSLDFHTVSVWGVKRALEEAYKLGCAEINLCKKNLLKEKFLKYPFNYNLIEAIIDVLDYLIKENYIPNKVYINDFIDGGPSVLFSIENDVRLTDAFLDKAYGKALDIEQNLFEKDVHAHISYVDIENLNEALLEEDGFVAFNIRSNE